MKVYFLRIAAAALTALTALTAAALVSCAPDETDHLAYQEYPMRAQATLTADGVCLPVTLDAPEPDTLRIAFAGGSLAGSAVTVTDGEAVFEQSCAAVGNGEYSVPLALDADSPISALAAAFSLRSSDMTGADGSGGDLRVSYRLPGGGVTVALADGVPQSMEFTAGDGGFTLEITGFSGGG